MPSASDGVGTVPTGVVVFDRYRDGPEGRYLDTYLLDAAGHERRVEFPVAADERRAVLSPDGRTLLVNSWSFVNGASVGTLDLATGLYTPLEPEIAGGLDCSDWTPDGTSVICALSGDTEADDGIYSVRLEDGMVTRLTVSDYHFVEGTAGACGGGESRAVYSPDGAQFAFEQQKCGTGADPGRTEQGSIVVASADGSDPQTIIPFGGVRTHPGGEISWSSEGDMIAFATQEGVLAVVNADGTDRHPVSTHVAGFVYGPAWSPDDEWILVSIDDGLGADLYAVAADGSRAIQLTDTVEHEVYTDWGVAAP